MPGQNLTRDEARARAAEISADSYTIELDLTDGDKTFVSTTVVRFGCAAAGASTWLDLIAPSVREVVLNGRSLNPAEVFDGKRVRLDDLAADNEVRVVADCAYMHTGEGLHRFVDPVDGEIYLHSQFEVADARRMYACFEQPDLKAPFTLSVTAPDHWQVVSVAATPKPEPVREGVACWAFEPTPPISTYITALVAGPYHVEREAYVSDGRNVPLGVFCRMSLAAHLDAAAIFEVTKQGFAYYENLFDYPYPFTKYDQLFVPEFNAGAMENAGCVTILEDYVFRSKVTDAAYERRAETILHELAHMWFGDLVTMRWWDDLWLNESFATYASVRCQADVTRWSNAWTTFANAEKLWALRQDQLPSTHPISADIRDLEDVEVNFDGITYAKGASVLKQLVAWVGPEEFFAGLRTYFRRFEWGNTELRDLLGCLEETSGRDLTAWSDEWLRTAGVATLRSQFEVDDEGRFTSFAVSQEAPAEHPTLRSHRLAIGLYDQLDGSIVRRHRVEIDLAGERTEVPQLTGRHQPDLILLNDDDLSFAKIRLDERSQRTLVESIGDIAESLPRTLCWTAATDMLRDAELSAHAFVSLVLAGIDRESDITVVQTLVASTKAAVDLYAEPAARAELGARWAAGMYERAHAAAPQSDQQLAFVRAWVAAARSDEHIAEMRGLLDGSVVIDGLAVDTDLRWLVLQRLVTLGAADVDDIEAELARDDTATGRRQAALARAARPTPEAKEEAWRLAVASDELPNALQVATLQGFVQPDQRELLRPFVDRYFEIITDLWATRTNEMAQNIVVRLYPRLLAEPATVERSDAWLSATEAPPALRRLVLEGRADVQRALAAQACDREAATSA